MDLTTIRWNYEQIFNRPPRKREVRRLLRKMPLLPTLRNVAMLGVLLFRGQQPVDVALQKAVATVLGGRAASRLIGLLDSNQSLWIYPEQVASMAKLAILHCPDPGPKSLDFELLFQALLAFNYLYDAETQVSWAQGNKHLNLLPSEIRQTFLNEGNISFVINRFASFIEWARTTKDDVAFRNRLDVDKLMEEAVGSDYGNYVASALAFMTHVGATSVDAKQIATFNPFLNLNAFLAGVENREPILAWLRRNSVSIDEARATLQLANPSLSAASMYKLAATPLLRTADNVLLCPALQFLTNTMGNGLFFKLNDHLRDTSGEKSSTKLRMHYATFLEVHVRDCVTRALRNTGSRIFPPVRYGRGGGTESTEVVVVEGSVAVFIEVNAKRFHVLKSVLGLDFAQIRRDLTAMVIEKVGEVRDRVAEFRDGKFVFPGVDSRTITRFIALIVTNQEVPHMVGCPYIINEALKDQLGDLALFDWVDVEEIELLPKAYPKGDLMISELLFRKSSDAEYGAQSLTNFLYYREYDRLRADLVPREHQHGSFFQAVTTATKTWGFRDGRAGA